MLILTFAQLDRLNTIVVEPEVTVAGAFADAADDIVALTLAVALALLIEMLNVAPFITLLHIACCTVSSAWA